MTSGVRKISLAFVVGKLLIDGEDYVLLRHDPKWNDLTFVGGHANKGDEGDLAKTAIRETQEEIPGLHWSSDFTINALTETMEYGPIWSRSVREDTAYLVRFYHLRLIRLPHNFRQIIRADKQNLLVPISKLFSADCEARTSQFVILLNRQFPGGLASIPRSWNEDVAAVLG
jgi:NUDIX domain